MCVNHAKRIEDAFLEEPVQTLARNSLDEERHIVCGAAVIPLVSRMERQRHRRPPNQSLLQCGCTARPCLLLLREEASRRIDASGMGQDVAERDGTIRLDTLDAAVHLENHFLVGKFGHVLGNRVVQEEIALLEQHHERRAHDGLGH